MQKSKDNSRKIKCNYSHLITMVENLPLIAFITDKNYNFITGNAEAKKFFNIEEKKKFPLLTEFTFESDSLELIKKENEYILRNKQTFIIDKLVKMSNGRQLWIRKRQVPIFGKQNKIDGFMVFVRDISCEKAAQKQRESFISTISHDLKIPTIAQIRAIELLLDGGMGQINEQQREILNLTLESCKFMHDMLSSLLAAYKYENKDISLNFEKIEITKLIPECFERGTKSIREKSLQIHIKTPENLIIYADKGQITKAFEYLIKQCISSAYRNTKITCEAKMLSNGQIFVSLDFESPYVSSTDLNNMFKMHTSPEEKLDKVGSSLGLYLSKQIINAHNGDIIIESSESNHSTYKINLPCINECKLPAHIC